jgi:hypothetical protein
MKIAIILSSLTCVILAILILVKVNKKKTSKQNYNSKFVPYGQYTGSFSDGGTDCQNQFSSIDMNCQNSPVGADCAEYPKYYCENQGGKRLLNNDDLDSDGCAGGYVAFGSDNCNSPVYINNIYGIPNLCGGHLETCVNVQSSQNGGEPSTQGMCCYPINNGPYAATSACWNSRGLSACPPMNFFIGDKPPTPPGPTPPGPTPPGPTPPGPTPPGPTPPGPTPPGPTPPGPTRKNSNSNSNTNHVLMYTGISLGVCILIGLGVYYYMKTKNKI